MSPIQILPNKNKLIYSCYDLFSFTIMLYGNFILLPLQTFFSMFSLQFICKLKFFNKILKRAVTFFSGMSDSTDSSFRFKHKFIIQYSYRLEKKIHCTKWGLKILRIFIIITNGIRKVRKGVEISEKKNFGSCKFISDTVLQNRPCLHQTFPCSRQSINQYQSAWCTSIRILIQGLQSFRIYPRFTEFPSLSRVYRVPVSIQGLQSFRLDPGFTEFPS